MRFNKPIKGFTYKDNQSKLNIMILFFQNTLKKAQKRKTANILKKYSLIFQLGNILN